MACAAPGKETDLNPFSLIEDASFSWSMMVRTDNPAGQLALTAEVSLEKIGGGLRKAMREARLNLRDVGPECYGRLQVDEAGQPLLSREFTSGGSWKAPGPGGALPAFAGMDCEMIAGLIAEYGPEGSRYTGDAPATASSGRKRGECSSTFKFAEYPFFSRQQPAIPPQNDRDCVKTPGLGKHPGELERWISPQPSDACLWMPVRKSAARRVAAQPEPAS